MSDCDCSGDWTATDSTLTRATCNNCGAQWHLNDFPRWLRVVEAPDVAEVEVVRPDVAEGVGPAWGSAGPASSGTAGERHPSARVDAPGGPS